MSLVRSSYASLYSSPPLPRTFQSAKQNPLLFSQTNHFLTRKVSFFSSSGCSCNTLLGKPSVFVVKASETEAQTSKTEGEGEGEREGEQYEEYEVEIVQPYGLKFAKGRDGGTYIDAIAPGGSADKTGKFQVGDKVIATSCWIREDNVHYLPANWSISNVNAKDIRPNVYATTVVSASDGDHENIEFKEESFVDGKKQQEGGEEGEEAGEDCVESILKKEDSIEVLRKKVQWMDFLGKELVEIREFEASEAEDTDNYTEFSKGCVCTIL